MLTNKQVLEAISELRSELADINDGAADSIKVDVINRLINMYFMLDIEVLLAQEDAQEEQHAA